MAQAAQDQVTSNGEKSAAFKMIQTQLAFFILKTAFDMPAAKGHMKDTLQRNTCGGIGDKILRLIRERMTCHDQPAGSRRQIASIPSAVAFVVKVQIEPELRPSYGANPTTVPERIAQDARDLRFAKNSRQCSVSAEVAQ